MNEPITGRSLLDAIQEDVEDHLAPDARRNGVAVSTVRHRPSELDVVLPDRVFTVTVREYLSREVA